MKRLVLSLLLGALASPGIAAAQAGPPERGQLVEVSTFSVDPAQAPAFEAAVMKVVKAAKEAKVKSAWHFWTEGWQYHLVYPVPNMAYFDDPMAFEKQFEGTPGQATLEQAFGDMETVGTRVTLTEVAETVPGWGHRPAAPPTNPSFGHINEFWIKPGKDRAFDAVVKEFMAFFKEVGYGYEVLGHRVHFGATGRAVFVTFVDNLENFYGSKSLPRLIQQKKADQKWQALLARLAAVIDRSDESTIMYRPDLSFMPPTGS